MRPDGADQTRRDRLAAVGTFAVEIHVHRIGGRPEEAVPIKCLVDTGAAFCQLPAGMLARLGITADRQVPVVLAHGTRRDQATEWIELRYGELKAFTLALVAGDDGLALLGAHALEGLGLAVDPVRKVLEPTRFPLA
jgi:predicted aspartyl protease